MRTKKNNTKQANKPKVVGLYSRISREDSAVNESLSITNQKKYLEKYALSHGFSHFVHYADDGYSGTNFDRPAWNKLFEDAKNGHISTVITKDLSRIGRNYLQVGLITESLLPSLGVRLIAIDNGVDSLNQDSTEFAAIMNLANEYFIKDFSQRMKTAWRAKRVAGLPTCTVGLYGYKKDPSNPDKWIVDEPAAVIVRYIFQLASEGKKPRAIANQLYREQVEKPSYYRAKNAPNG
jgi:DNA invertase Pin-like site-specific DNA recombinase